MTAERLKKQDTIKETLGETPLKLVENIEDKHDDSETTDTHEVGCSKSLSHGVVSQDSNTTPEIENIEEPEVSAVYIDNIQTNQAGKPQASEWSTLKEAITHYILNWKGCLDWLGTLKAPLFLLVAVAIKPKLILLWVFIILAKPISMWLYDRLPVDWKTKFKQALPSKVRNSLFLRDMSEGADQGLPFILFWLYLCCAPFAIAWIALHWLKGFRSQAPDPKIENGFIFTQNKRPDAVHSETNFYYSRAFGIVLFLFFASGIPAFFTYAVFENTGFSKTIQTAPIKEALVFYKPNDQAVVRPIKWIGSYHKRIKPDARRGRPQQSDANYIVGYSGYWPSLQGLGVEPSKNSVFFVHFYLMGLATAISILFFRAWFLFPLNFLADEHDIVFTESGIKRKSLKSWFLSVVTINGWAVGTGPDSLFWHEVKSLRRLEDGFFKLSPLPETAFKKESLTYKLLNKLASLIDGVTSRSYTGNYLIFSSVEKDGDFGRNIKINLNDLNREQRAKLFYSVKKWAPHVIVQDGVEEQLVGSTVLRDNRYTQLWFDVLTYRSRTKKGNVLEAGESLKGGEYKIDERLSSGGQATAYLATRKDGQKCVLKEFILATSSTSAPIESAREFEAEVSLLSQLNHPGIVKLEDFFFDEGRVYVALEYIDGRTLRQKVQQDGPLSDKEVVQITESICDVLEYLHGCNPPIVHRDITPENVLVRADGTIKLIDFSLAVRNDGRQTTDSCAKQCFTPPEQFREEVCVQSDIYSLGATMYYLLTGLIPKPISSSSPRAKTVQVSAELNSIVERATKLDLSERYESVYWLKLDLANLNIKELVATGEFSE